MLDGDTELLFQELKSPHVNLNRVRYFLQNGVDVNAINNNSRCVLSVAVSNALASPDIVTEILKYNPDLKANHSSYTVLHDAVRNPELKTCTLRQLIKAGADVNAIDAVFHKTPLHVAIDNLTCSKIAIIKELINSGSQVNARALNCVTPLHLAVARLDSLKVIKLLLENGAEVNSMSDKYHTPLHYACHAYNNIAIRELMLNNADIHRRDISNETPLDFLCKKPNVECRDLQAKITECCTMMIKYFSIQKPYFQHLSQLSSSISLPDYVIKIYSTCLLEIRQIKAFIFYSDMSLSELLFKNYNLKLFPDFAVNRVFEVLFSDKFPIYKNDMLYNIHRSVLIQKVFRVLEFSVKNYTRYHILNQHSITEICKFLSRKDLINFIGAAYI